MAATKVEYPPLLEGGFHPKTIKEVRELCVEAKLFATSQTRAMLMDRLTIAISKLQAVEILGEIWLDGSFLTQKVDPDDIDLSLRVQAAICDNATSEQQACLNWLVSSYETEKIDGYLHVEFPSGDPNYALGIDAYNYWKKQWGVSRKGVAKGIVVIELSKGAK